MTEYIILSFQCEACGKEVERTLYKNTASLIKYCSDTCKGKHWRERHSDYMRNYWKEYAKL